ncbi:MAG: DegT/DnrJ/EryC1/StrS family aminotransferase [Sulfurimonas sp.]
MIHVTKTWLPDRQKYIAYVERIYANGWVTNNGPLVRELEEKLAAYLGVKHIVLTANGTTALETAYRLLKLEGEVITTPFSFVATTSSLVSCGLKPVFADIDPETFDLDPKHIEAKITDQTSAIVPVHVFGNVCEAEKIDAIARKHDLKVIYDASHAFGVNYKEQSILNYGDVSTLSFHATKLFHTIEGGALIINDDRLAEEARYLINFGIDGPDSVRSLGINAKMNEFEAAMGLCVLDDMALIGRKRREVFERYEAGLRGIVVFQKQNGEADNNFGYFPVLFESEAQTLEVQKALNRAEIFPRRYFYPSLDTLPYLENDDVMPISRDISSRILALPMFSELEERDQKKMIDIIKECLVKYG